MFKHSLGAVLAMGIAAMAADAIPDVRSDLTVHEWGTFTTVAGADGRAEVWRPIDGAVDLPCFVERAALPPKASFVTTVRMETPVVYFYSPRPVTVDVSVRFREGLMTEFFPRPTSSGERGPGLFGGQAMSRLEWKGVRVMPGARAEYQSEEAPNHYYAARVADAAPLEVGTQREGFLFYRGVGGFELPLRATVNPHRDVVLTNDGPDPVPALMLFENRGGRLGFTTSWLPAGHNTVLPVARDSGGLASVRAALAAMLIAQGLFAQEGEAMVETWSDSWFEEGTRVFYIVPRPLIERTLPLSIRPAPAVTERVFVGRLEIATPELLDDLQTAFAARDHAALAAHGRFLEPFSRRLLERGVMPDERAGIVGTLSAVQQEVQARAPRQCGTATH